MTGKEIERDREREGESELMLSCAASSTLASITRLLLLLLLSFYCIGFAIVIVIVIVKRKLRYFCAYSASHQPIVISLRVLSLSLSFFTICAAGSIPVSVCLTNVYHFTLPLLWQCHPGLLSLFLLLCAHILMHRRLNCELRWRRRSVDSGEGGGAGPGLDADVL